MPPTIILLGRPSIRSPLPSSHWREEFETIDHARAAIGAYIDRYHHRPHSGLNYRTPREVAATWQDHTDELNQAV